ncbi:MAG: hypothetical protein ACLP5V_06290 [Candidatus Bathyarchaeia archaeon]
MSLKDIPNVSDFREQKNLVTGETGFLGSWLSEASVECRCPDISKACSILRWEPKVGLKEGLSKTIDWFRRNKEPSL